MAGGYATEDFFLAWDAFAADHEDPLTCHSDRGSQIVAAAKVNPDLEVPNYDFDVRPRQSGISLLHRRSLGMNLWEYLSGSSR